MNRWSFVEPLLIISLVWCDLSLVAANLEMFIKPLLSKQQKSRSTVWILWNEITAYLWIDGLVTVAICLVLFLLTEYFISTANSHTALVIRWAGCLYILLSTAPQPLRLISKVFRQMHQIWNNGSGGRVDASQQELLGVWIQEMQSAAEFIVWNLGAQILFFYLAFVTIAFFLEKVFQDLSVSGQNQRYYDLLFFVNDWLVTILIATTMLLFLIHELSEQKDSKTK